MQSQALQKVSRSKGISLIEVLVALVIISVGLLGLASLQANSLRFNHSAYTRTQATQLAFDIVERMRVNRQGARNGDYDITMAAAAPAGATIADQDLQAWLGEIAAVLPSGDAEIARVQVTAGPPALNRFTITVQWIDDRSAAVQAPQQFVFVTEL